MAGDNHDERSVRIQKLHTLRTLGINPYPDTFTTKQDIIDVRKL